MALNKNISSVRGTIIAYWKIIAAEHNYITNKTTVYLNGYKDAAERADYLRDQADVRTVALDGLFEDRDAQYAELASSGIFEGATEV